MIKVNYKDKVFEVEEGISALDFIKNNIDVDLNTVMARLEVIYDKYCN